MAKRSNPVEPAGLASELVRELHKRDLIDDHGGRVIELMMRRTGMSYSEALAVVAKAVKVDGRATGWGIVDAYQKMYASPAKKAQLERLHDLRLEGMVDSKAYRPRAVTLEKLGRMIDVKLGKGRKANPADDAAAMYESFHGAPSTGELVIEDKVHYHGNLAELGVLCGLKVRVVTGYDVTLQFGGGPGQQEGNHKRFTVKASPDFPGYWIVFDNQARRPKTGAIELKTDAQAQAKLFNKDSNAKGWQAYSKTNKGKAGPGPLTKAYRFGTGIVPGLLEGADSALGKVVNPNALYDRIAAHFASGGVVAVATYAKQTVYKSLDWFKPGKGDEVGVYVRRGKHWDYVLPQYIRYGTYKKNARNPGSDTGPVILCSNEAGNQLYFRGGDQALDLASIKMADFERDHMVIGEVWGLAYATKKEFDKFQEIEYVHILGLEKFHQRMAKSADLWEDALPPKDEAFGCGNLPVLNYDTLNTALSLAGGVYKIPKPWSGTSPGITD